MKHLTLTASVAEIEDGTRALIVGYDVPEDAPPAVREGLARRALVARSGRCPCGAQVAMPSRAERRAAQRAGQPMRRPVEHEHDCPAADDNLVPALRDAGWSV